MKKCFFFKLCSQVVYSELLKESNLDELSMSKFYQVLFKLYPEYEFNLRKRKIFIKSCVRKFMQKKFDREHEKENDNKIEF